MAESTAVQPMVAEVAQIRRADPADALTCARLLSIASHGMAEAVYAGLVPGQSTEEIIAERRIRAAGQGLLRRELVARGSRRRGDRRRAQRLSDGRPVAGRRATTRSARSVSGCSRRSSQLEAVAPGTYFVNVLAVFPAYRHAGLAQRLIALAEGEARDCGLARAEPDDLREGHPARRLLRAARLRRRRGTRWCRTRVSRSAATSS